MEWMFTLSVLILTFVGAAVVLKKLVSMITNLVSRPRLTANRMYRSRRRHLARD